MTTIWPNGFAGGVDWRSWGDGLWQTAFAGGLGPDASGEPQAKVPDAPAVVITNAAPSTLETYAPPSGMPSDFFTEMDLAAYFSLIGYDPAAIEEMNANGSYRSEHDIYQANGGLQSQAEAAWRRSGQWASGAGFNDPGRELFLNNYMDRAYGVDAEAGTARSAANMAQYLSMLEGALNAASKAVFDNKDKPDEEKYRQNLIALRSSIEQLGFNVSRVVNGVAIDPDLTDKTSEVGQRSRHIVSVAAGSDPYQTGGMDGFQLVGRAGGYGNAAAGNAARRDPADPATWLMSPSEQPGNSRLSIMDDGVRLKGRAVVAQIDKLRAVIDAAASTYGVDANLVRAIIFEEQTKQLPFEATAEALGFGSTIGLGQITEGYFGLSREDLKNPTIAVNAIARHLNSLTSPGSKPLPDPHQVIVSIASRYNNGTTTQVTNYGRRVAVYHSLFGQRN